uniref:Sodium-dependent multivitamin transporter n=1 Tax=Strigamia maritima TaxID=126957 RepID=T1IR62_STRMM
MQAATLFSVLDYAILVVVLIASLGIGVYFACFGGKQKTTNEYFRGDRNMAMFPVVLSMMASFISSNGMLGVPAEVYLFGFNFWYLTMGVVMGLPTALYGFMPVFYKMQITSVFEYLEHRFDHRLRSCGSVMNILTLLTYASFVTYGPALALSQVTGLSVWASVLTTTVIGTVYTSIGGIKAVMWTDSLQITIFTGALLATIIKGTIDVGGLPFIIEKSIEGDRLGSLSFSFDPRVRYTFWGLLISSTLQWMQGYGTSQIQVQRYMSCPNRKTAEKSIWLNIVGLIPVHTIYCYVGLILYAMYSTCDPLRSRQIEQTDQIFPIFVMHTMSSVPGMPGVFVAGVYSASLSTTSSVLNSLAAITLEDHVKPRWKSLTDARATYLSKLIAVAYGVVCIMVIAIIMNLGGIVEAIYYLVGGTNGATVGLFVLGLMNPYANSKGSLVGIICGLGVGWWISIGNQIYRPPPFSILSLSTANCTDILEDWTPRNKSSDNNPDDIFDLYRISYFWIMPIAFFVTVLVGSFASLFMGSNENLNPDLLSPFTHTIMKKFFVKKYKELEHKYKPVSQNLENGDFKNFHQIINNKNGFVNEEDHTPVEANYLGSTKLLTYFHKLKTTLHVPTRHIYTSFNELNCKQNFASVIMQVVSTFSILDYAILIAVLVLSLGIGVYFASFGGRQKTTNEYFKGDRNMAIFPVVLSMMASFMSSNGMLGVPAEVYLYGFNYWFMNLGVIVGLPIALYGFMPVFYNMQITSVFEYIETRFDKRLRLCGSIMNILSLFSARNSRDKAEKSQLTFASFVTYGPALALSQVTGLSVWSSVLTTIVIGTVYTTIGGIKAVMWSDSLQITIFTAALLAALIKGSMDVGGMSYVIEKAIEGERLTPLSFSFDPRVRFSFWGMFLSSTLFWMQGYGTSQVQVQRYMSCPNRKTAEKSIWINIAGLVPVGTVYCFVGIILYAMYWNCDPLSSQQIEQPDQIFPLFVMHTMTSIPGMPGIFVAGVYSAALSTTSSVLNSLAAITLEDHVKPRWKGLTDEKATIISKVIAVGYGIVCIIVIAAIMNLGSIVQAIYYLVGGTNGATLGLFVLGLMNPYANSKGSLLGILCGLGVGWWISIGNQVYRPPPFSALPLDTTNCTDILGNWTLRKKSSINPDDVADIYRISYFWIMPIAFSVTVLVGSVSSFFMGSNENLNPQLLSPYLHKVMKKFFNKKYEELEHNYKPVSQNQEDENFKNSKKKINQNGVTRLPAEVYHFGADYWYTAVGAFIGGPIGIYGFMPVFYKLQITSIYEYIEFRFCNKLKFVNSIINIFSLLVFAGFVIYAPALALSQVTGLGVWTSIITTTVIGTVYTSIGGIKAVVWTDVLQLIIFAAAIIAILIKSCTDIGGISYVIQKNVEGKRLKSLSFSTDPTERFTAWGLIISSTIRAIFLYGVSQIQLQRYMCCPNKTAAKKSVWLNVIFSVPLTIMYCFIGLVLYATYWNCDPLSSSQIQKPDQLFPLFVMHTMSSIPGMPGLFVAGIYSAALSTLSSILNSLAAMTLHDHIKPRWPKLTDKKATCISKCLSAGYGVVCLFTIAAIMNLGSLVQAMQYMLGGTMGATLGLFFLGLMIPWANSKGSSVGLICGIVMSSWITIGTQIYRPPPSSLLPVSTENCTDILGNWTRLVRPNIKPEYIPTLYKISYLWIMPIAFAVTVSIGSLISAFIGSNKNLNVELLSPFVRSVMKKFFHEKYTQLEANYKSIPLRDEPMKEFNGIIDAEKADKLIKADATEILIIKTLEHLENRDLQAPKLNDFDS